MPTFDSVTVVLAGDPHGKGRPRAFARGKFVRMYTPEKTRTYEGMIRTAAMDAMAGRPPIADPVEIELSAIFAVPASWSQKKRALAIAGELRPAKKPDADNIVKAWTDAMNGVVFADDCQIVKGSFAKAYGPAALVAVTVRPLVLRSEKLQKVGEQDERGRDRVLVGRPIPDGESRLL